jgi:hypothetical protein
MSDSSSAQSKTPLLSDAKYKVLKHTAAVALPALSALYFALAQIWHLPKAEEVIGTIAAVNTAVGTLVGISTLIYNKSDAKYVGAIEVTDDGSKKTYSLNLNTAPEALETMSTATFKVTPTPPAS